MGSDALMFYTFAGVAVLGALAVLARRGQQSGNTLLLALGAAACGALLLVLLRLAISGNGAHKGAQFVEMVG